MHRVEMQTLAGRDQVQPCRTWYLTTGGAGGSRTDRRGDDEPDLASDRLLAIGGMSD
jgi:hypothetical protein